MTDATFAETQGTEIPIDFQRLQQAAVSYEQHYAPQFWQLRQQLPADWQALAEQLQKGVGSPSAQSGLQALLADWPDPQALQAALLAAPLSLLETCCQELRAGLHSQVADLTAPLTHPDSQNEEPPTLAQLLLNLLEAHLFGSVVARAPAELQRALAALQDLSLEPFQVLIPQLPVELHTALPAQGSALATWLEALPDETISRLREACYTQQQTLTGSARQPFVELLVCLNSTLVLRQ
ncbi:MAG: hypothetical protein AB7I41_03225 [Candidatus Sericytochromatia bacterium]